MWPDNWIQEGPDVFSSEELQANKYVIARPKRLLNVKAVMSYFSNVAVILLTFGLCSPFLALALIASTTVTCAVWLMFLGRFMHYRVFGIPKYEDHAVISLNKQLSEAIGLLKVCVWPVVNSSCLFFAFLCWDMAGDEVGVSDAIYIPCIALSMPVLIWASIRIFEWHTQQKIFNLASKSGSVFKRLTGGSFRKSVLELRSSVAELAPNYPGTRRGSSPRMRGTVP
jgi:hypothetical protein